MAPAGPAVRATPGRPDPLYLGAVSRQAVDRAVRVADGLLVYCSTPEDFVARYDLLQQVLGEHGRDERGFPFVATGIVHVDRDADRAWDEAAPAIAYLEGGIASYAAGRDGPATDPRPEGLRRADLLVGTPDQVAERLVALHRRAPYDQFAFWGRLPGFGHEQALRSIRLFASEVAPEVRAGLASG